MAIKRGTNKGFDLKQTLEIEYFLESISGLINRNMRTVHTKNPRMIRIVLDELQAIKAEIEPIEIAMSDIDVTRVITTRENLTEVERYLWSSLPIPMGNAINKLREVKRAKVYNIEHPVEKREAEINKLTGDIVKLEEINVALKSLGDGQAIERNIEKIERKELEISKIRESFNNPTLEEIQFDLFSSANLKFVGLKNQVNEAIEYLTELMEVLA